MTSSLRELMEEQGELIETVAEISELPPELGTMLGLLIALEAENDFEGWPEPPGRPVEEEEGGPETTEGDSKEHSPSRCMVCEQPPTIVVIWADGRGRAWFCDECFEEWSNEEPRDIVAEHRLEEGEDPSEWRPKPPGLKEVDESLCKDSKEVASGELTDGLSRARILHESEIAQKILPLPEEVVRGEELEEQGGLVESQELGLEEKSTSMEELAESTIHRSFTVLADGLFALGYLTREERIALSSLIGDSLDRFGELYQERMIQEPGYADPEIEPEDVRFLLASLFKTVLDESKEKLEEEKRSASLKDRFGEARAVAKTIMKGLRSKNKSALSVWKDSTGVARYVALCSAEVEDLEEETVQTKAMDFSIDLCQKHGFRPLLTVTHAPWARVGKDTWEIRLGKFWLEGGVFDKTWLAEKAYKAIEEDREGELRISIAFLYLPSWRNEKGRYEQLFRYASGITKNPALPITAIQVMGGVDNVK